MHPTEAAYLSVLTPPRPKNLAGQGKFVSAGRPTVGVACSSPETPPVDAGGPRATKRHSTRAHLGMEWGREERVRSKPARGSVDLLRFDSYGQEA